MAAGVAVAAVGSCGWRWRRRQCATVATVHFFLHKLDLPWTALRWGCCGAAAVGAVAGAPLPVYVVAGGEQKWVVVNWGVDRSSWQIGQILPRAFGCGRVGCWWRVGRSYQRERLSGRRQPPTFLTSPAAFRFELVCWALARAEETGRL